MSLEAIEKHIKELTAIKEYDQVKKDRDDLREANATLQTNVQVLSKENEDLKLKFEESEKAAHSLAEASDKKDIWLQETSNEVSRLNERIKELEDFKMLGGNTLAETEKRFLEAKENEITKKSEEKFSSMKSEWEKSEKPKEVRNESFLWLKNIVENLRKPPPRIYIKEVAETGLPDEVERIIKDDVDRRLDSEFNKRVNEESERKASKVLQQKVNVEWPKWKKENVEPKIRELEGKISTQVVTIVKGPWTIPCDKCGTKRSFDVGAAELDTMIRQSHFYVECANPRCEEWWQRHKIKVSLSSLIEAKMSA